MEKGPEQFIPEEQENQKTAGLKETEKSKIVKERIKKMSEMLNPDYTKKEVHYGGYRKDVEKLI
jgi:hypothetical protein